MPEIVTANRLKDGVVVYLTASGGWEDDIRHAHVAQSKEETRQLLETAEQSIRDRTVVSVYEMKVAMETGVPSPVSVREKIRAQHKTTLTKDGYVQV